MAHVYEGVLPKTGPSVGVDPVDPPWHRDLWVLSISTTPRLPLSFGIPLEVLFGTLVPCLETTHSRSTPRSDSVPDPLLRTGPHSFHLPHPLFLLSLLRISFFLHLSSLSRVVCRSSSVSCPGVTVLVARKWT